MNNTMSFEQQTETEHHDFYAFTKHFRELREQAESNAEWNWEHQNTDVETRPYLSFFPAKATASEQLNMLIGNLKAINLLSETIYGADCNWRTMPKDAQHVLTNASEYLKHKVRAMLKEEDWLMDYIVSYSAGYFKS